MRAMAVAAGEEARGLAREEVSLRTLADVMESPINSSRLAGGVGGKKMPSLSNARKDRLAAFPHCVKRASTLLDKRSVACAP